MNRWLRLSAAAALPACLALAPGLALAQGIDLTQGGPIQVTAQNGIEWRQADQVVVARGDAKASRGTVTVTADELSAWYRPKKDNAPPAAGRAARASQPPAGETPAGIAGPASAEGNEVYRLRAEGQVHVFTPTDNAWGDQATYDLDRAVLVMTGRSLKLTTPTNTLTARDTLEYWADKRMAVARGDASVLTSDARRISADTLVAFTAPPRAGPPASQPAAAASGAVDGAAALAGKLERVEAFNRVTIRTATDFVTGDLGVYEPDSGIARLAGHVRITRGDNQINGAEAIVNMKTGVATLTAGGEGRVSGLVVPNNAADAAGPARTGKTAPPP